MITLKKNFFQDVQRLRSMFLNDNRLTELPVGLFNGLSNLDSLFLDYNNLTSLSTNLFQGLANLDQLSLNNNKLDNLPVGIFLGLTSLKKLHLSFNEFTRLPNDIFNETNLNVLELQNNKLKELNPNTFRNLFNLNKLLLNNNALIKLPAGVFKGLTNLKELYLDCNQLRHLPDNTFNETSLTLLQLQNNNLRHLTPEIFQNLINLNKLFLQNNALDELPAGIFKELTNLNELNLAFNNLRELPNGLFNETDLILLQLQNNSLRELNSEIFQNSHHLNQLYLQNNMLLEIPTGIFQGLSNLRELFLFFNKLRHLPIGLFSNTDLILNNNVGELNPEIFQRLSNLKWLFLHNNMLIKLPARLFQGLRNLQVLTLHYNSLTSLNPYTFQDLDNLEQLVLNNNMLTQLPAGLFRQLKNLKKLWLQYNKLKHLPKDSFQGIDLTYVKVSNNMLVDLPAGLFQGLTNLQELYLQSNMLTFLPYDSFYGLGRLMTLQLGDNRLKSLDKRLFKDLKNLQSLNLYWNEFGLLEKNILRGLIFLKFLFLSSCGLFMLDNEIFKDNKMLEHIELDGNRLTQVPNLKGLTHLNYLNLRYNVLANVDAQSFVGFAKSAELFVSQHEICDCFVPIDLKCDASSRRSPYLTCERLLSDRSLVILIWVIGVNALCGNLFVVIWRLHSSQKNKVQDSLLTNLALSDLLMGIYLLVIASADLYFGQNFPMRSATWRSGITCKVTGALSIISSEASVFFVTLISIDRFISIRFPFTTNKLSKNSVNVAILITWIISLALGIVPSILSGVNFKFYDNSHVCIGLPLSLTERFHTKVTITEVEYHVSGEHGELQSFKKTAFNTTSLGNYPAMFYSSAVFLGLNCICYFAILCCYVEIVRTVLKSAKRAKYDREMKDQVRMTVKVAAIVATDFCCWFPIIIMGILVQTRVVTLPTSVYAWSVTFVLPINSAINPYLYTISAIISDRKHNQLKAQRKSHTGSSSVTVSTSQQKISSITQGTWM